MTKQSFIKGALILALAGFLTRFLGFINKMIVARVLGAEGVGLYMMAVPTLLLVLTLTQLGLPIAVSKLIAEAEARHAYEETRRILQTALLITTSASIVLSVLTFFVAPILASTFLTDERALYPLLAIIPVIPIVAVSSVLRGYFQGRQNMVPTAVSSVVEQVVRITCVALLTTLFLPYGIEYAAAGAMVSVILGEAFSLIYLLFQFRKYKDGKVKPSKQAFHRLMQIGLPTTGSRFIGSISFFFEPIVVAQCLMMYGIAATAGTILYGELTGFAIPMILLPNFLTFALSTSLVPFVSEAHSRNDLPAIHYRIHQVMKYSMLSGGISAICLFFFAEEIMGAVYHAPETGVYLSLLAPFSVILYVQGPLQAVLQAIDAAKQAMVNSLIGALVKLSAIYVLTASFGIMGTAVAIIIGFIVVTCLHVLSVASLIGFSSDRRFIQKLLLLVTVTTCFAWWTSSYVHSTLTMLVAIVAISCVYVICILLLKLVEKRELKRFT